MDLGLYARVLWRRRLIVVFGLYVAIAAAVLSVYRVGGDGLEAREKPEYESFARLFVARGNLTIFPADTPPLAPEDTTEGRGTAYTPQQLADLYTYLLVSDEFTAELEQRYGLFRTGEQLDGVRRTAAPEALERAPEKSVFPVLEIRGTALTPEAAQRVTQTAAETLVSFIDAQETEAGVADVLRVRLRVIQSANHGLRVDSGSPIGTMTIVFLGVLATFIAIAFVRESVAESPPDADALSTAGDEVRPVALHGVKQQDPASRVSS